MARTITARKIYAQVDKNCERWLLLVFYTMIVTTIGVEVVRRFVLSYSSIWGEEVARYAFIYLVWIGLAAVVRDRSSIRIDVLLHIIPVTFKAFFYLLGDIVMVIVAMFALFYSIETFLTSLKFSSVTHGLRIANTWFLFAVPFGFSLTLFRLFQSIFNDVNALKRGDPVFEGKKLFD